MLDFILEPHIHYTHTGEYFSKLLLLHASQKQGERLLHIVESSLIQKRYKALAIDLGIPYQICETYNDLHSLMAETSGLIGSICIEDIEKPVSKKHFDACLTLKQGQEVSMEQIFHALQALGYSYHEYERPGSYIRKGDRVKIQLPHSGTYTLNFWGNQIESIEANENTLIEKIRLFSLEKIGGDPSSTLRLKDILQQEQIFCILDMLEFHPAFETLMKQDFLSSSFGILGNQENQRRDLRIQTLSCSNLEELRSLIQNPKIPCSLFTRQSKILGDFLKDNQLKNIPVQPISSSLLSSFSYKGEQNYICDDILQKIFVKKRLKKKLSADVDLLLKIQKGDYIVHIDHGVGLFQGIVQKELTGIRKEYLEISYLKEEKLFVPITEVHRVSKYVGKEHPTLTPLGGKVWEKKMQKIHEDIREIAEELLKNFAERKLRNGQNCILETRKMETFQEKFPYHYTLDQSQAIEDIFEDMQSSKNMDRLLVGDVGFGKTEVAFNAAYLALSNKKQVVLISPLVVLAHEHYSKALERFSGLNIRIEVLTRLQSQAHASRVLKGLADGSIDMVIGTHRLLSEKLSWKRLGLLIIDEEHKFGVVDKEKIKHIKADIDILSLSATPIPRSLNLALSGVRDISLLKTPPEGRKSISTFVTRYNEKIIQDAGQKELDRGGQIFFVHNRVGNIEVVGKQMQALFPKKKIIITHGQLPGDELEDRILAFKEKKYDILLSTTVIENGIDFSNVNTIFINECQSFGISQIHQLRGRVGRSDTQGYCYLLYRKEQLDSEAAKRLQTIVDYSYLGAGFELAMKDLEIRGGGDILGVKQSGQAQEIGVSLFLKMLEEKIEDLKNNPSGEMLSPLTRNSVTIELGISAGVPDIYFLSETDKLQFYREIEMVEEYEDLEYLKESFFSHLENMQDIPEESKNLFLILECQILAREYHISSIKKVGVNFQIEFALQDISILKSFLALDTQVRFQVVDISKLRCPTKVFENDKKFLEYVRAMLQGKNILSKKIKLVSKSR